MEPSISSLSYLLDAAQLFEHLTNRIKVINETTTAIIALIIHGYVTQPKYLHVSLLAVNACRQHHRETLWSIAALCISTAQDEMKQPWPLCTFAPC